MPFIKLARMDVLFHRLVEEVASLRQTLEVED
jgi:hypothetical protein